MNETNREALTIKLKDGRTLGYAEFGDPNGKPVLYFHGYPGSRLEPKVASKSIKKAGVRIVSTDRPGMGLSDPKPKRELLDWPEDVMQLARALKIDKYTILGTSGGGPYSLACAYKIPHKNLQAAATCGGMGPIEAGTDGMKESNKKVFSMAKKTPWLLRLIMWLTFGRKVKDVESAYQYLLDRKDDFPEADQNLFENPKFGRVFAESNFAAQSQGTKWVVYEGQIYVQPWGFNLEDIPSETKVYVFQGEIDDQVPIGMARYMEQRIPNCEANYFPNETHFGAALNHIEEMCETLISHL